MPKKKETAYQKAQRMLRELKEMRERHTTNVSEASTAAELNAIATGCKKSVNDEFDATMSWLNGSANAGSTETHILVLRKFRTQIARRLRRRGFSVKCVELESDKKSDKAFIRVSWKGAK